MLNDDVVMTLIRDVDKFNKLEQARRNDLLHNNFDFEGFN